MESGRRQAEEDQEDPGKSLKHEPIMNPKDPETPCIQYLQGVALVGQVGLEPAWPTKT